MKTYFTILLLSLVGFASAQSRVHGKAIPMTIEKRKAQPAEVVVSMPESIFGQYKISKYSIVSKKCPTKKDLSLLVGTLVKVNASALTGDEIDPLTFDIYEIEKMSSADYIFREFGRSFDAPNEHLPATCKVHKISAESYYGIIEISKNQMVIPYKGVLLFLERL